MECRGPLFFARVGRRFSVKGPTVPLSFPSDLLHASRDAFHRSLSSPRFLRCLISHTGRSLKKRRAPCLERPGADDETTPTSSKVQTLYNCFNLEHSLIDCDMTIMMHIYVDVGRRTARAPAPATNLYKIFTLMHWSIINLTYLSNCMAHAHSGARRDLDPGILSMPRKAGRGVRHI